MRKPEVEKKTLLKIEQVNFIAVTKTDSYHPKLFKSSIKKIL
jgi:hypothetical protein